MRKTLLEKCEEVISYTPWPFTRNNLTTAKIFNDLLQFHGDFVSAAQFYNQPSIDGSLQSGIGSKGALLKGQYQHTHTPSVGRNNNLASQSIGNQHQRSRPGMHATQVIGYHAPKGGIGGHNYSTSDPTGVFAGGQTLGANQTQGSGWNKGTIPGQTQDSTHGHVSARNTDIASQGIDAGSVSL